ncbi:MAG: ATP-binding protein [Acidobacteriota bacterium]
MPLSRLRERVALSAAKGRVRVAAYALLLVVVQTTVTLTNSDTSFGSTSWPASSPTTGRPMHAVQFYENEDFLYQAVSAFLADGLSAGHPAIVIATEPHRHGFVKSLKSKGFDTKNVVLADARETLASFMDGSMPDEELFKQHIGGLILKTGNGGGPSSIRAYGEMVDLLWRDSNPEGAIRLEELWNDLISAYSFSLLCAYPMGNFYKEAQCEPFDRVCHTHSLVLPAESLRDLSALQQRAGALEAEVEHRKELEKALRDALASRRQAESELKDFVENAAVGMHWVGPDGTILWANDAELKLLGYSRAEYVGHNIAEFHADQPVIEDIIARLWANEEIRDREARLLAKDGSIRYVEISSNSLFEDGDFKHTRCFTRDVSDRRRLEDERTRNEEANGFLLEAANVLYRTLDYETRLGELARLIVPKLADWCAVDIARDDGTFERVTVAGKVSYRPDDATILAVLRSGEGQIIDAGAFSSMIVPMRHTSGVLGVISFVTRSSRRRYTDADRSFFFELARRSGVAIENARLYRYAQQANRAKDEFLATLSHELRTPLTAILGWARMLRMGGIDKETEEVALDTIERSARTQASLIDDILDLSKVVTGKIALQNELVDLSGAVNNAIDTVRIAATAKRIRLDFAHPPPPAFVIGDPTRLQQIVWNLLSNAIKFSNPGSTVHVDLKLTPAVARMVVCDQGLGIRAEFLPHVFEPFRQAEASTTRAFGGLGLGLAIVKYFTELHGGTIAAESAGEGKGATFTITLPLAQRPGAAGEDDVELRAPAADLHGTSILLVDDDDDTRIVITAALRNCGAEVRAASSVAQACRLLDQKAPDILISDIAMPHEDGFALIDYLRTRRGTIGDIPAIALTALGLPHDDERILRAGFTAYARKPVEPLQFATVVAKFKR